MAETSLSKVGIRVAPLSRRIVLARFGKDPTLALDKRDAMNEFWQTLVQFAFDGKMPEQGEATEVRFGGGDQHFVARIERVKGGPG